MSEKAAFDPSQNAQNTAVFLDKELHQAEKPGDSAAQVTHDALLALQADSIPAALRDQVHADLLKLDPQADKLLSQMQITDGTPGDTMHVKDDNAPQDPGVLALRNVAMNIGGEIYSTNKVNAAGVQDLANYGSASNEGIAAAYVSNDLQLLGSNERVIAKDKGLGILNNILVAEGAQDTFTGHHGEFDLTNDSGKVAQKIGKYSERSDNPPGTVINIDGQYVPTPNNPSVTFVIPGS